jgi:phosphatidylglycerophosphate synthase
MTAPAPSEHESPEEIPPPKTYAHYAGRWLILPLINTPVTPNHLTTLRLLTGIAAVAAFAMGDYFWTAWGGALFAFSALLDRADGELARLSGKVSDGGHRYDLYCDFTVNIVLFIGIGIGLTDGVLGHWAWKMGLLSALSIGAASWVAFRLYESGDHPREAFNYPHGFDYDDALFLVSVFAWFDGLLPLLIAASVGAPLFLVFALWKYCTRPPQKGVAE